MQQYGKIENGLLLVYNGKSVRCNGRVYVNPSSETLKRLKYKLIINADMPEEKEGYYIIRTLSEDADNIYRGYELVEIPEEIEVAESEE